MKRLPKLVVAVDGTLLPGVRRLLRDEKGLPDWRETVTGVLPFFDSFTRHVWKSAEREDESDVGLSDTIDLRETIATYIETVDLAKDLQVFLEEYVTSGGEIVLVLPPLIAQDTTLSLRLEEKLSGLPASFSQVAGLDIEAIDDKSVVVVARTDEVRILMRAGKQVMAYVNLSRLIREIQMRTDVAQSASESRANTSKENRP